MVRVERRLTPWLMNAARTRGQFLLVADALEMTAGLRSRLVLESETAPLHSSPRQGHLDAVGNLTSPFRPDDFRSKANAPVHVWS
jgi:hypothetical protein